MRHDHVVIYDADCGMCRTLLALLLRADRDRRLRPLALGTAEADRLLADLTPERRDASWHLIDPSGRRTSAGAAGAPVLRLLRGGGLPAALLDRAPDATERVYAWVAGHRGSVGPLIPDAVKRRATRAIASRRVEAGGDVPDRVGDAEHGVEGERGADRRR